MLYIATAAQPFNFLPEVVALLVASAIIAYICHRLRILPIVGFLIAGVVIGPHALGLFRDRELIDSVAEIGVILLLFTLGIEFSMDRLWRIRRAIFLGGTLQVVSTIALTAGVVLLAGIPLRQGFFAGCLIALSSTALVLKVLEAKSEQSSPKGQLSIGILIFQDLAVVALVLLMPVLAGEVTSAFELAKALGTAILIIGLVLIVARRVMPPLLERVARTCSPEIFLLTILAICLGTAYVTNLAGLSLSLGAFLGGLVVSESRFSQHAFGEVMPLQILFSAAFFVSVGMLLDLGFVMRNPLLLLGLAVAIIVLKTVTTGLSALALGEPLYTAAGSALLLAQIGEFSFVLEREGRASGLHLPGAEGTGQQTFIATSVLLMAATPFLARAGEKLEAWLARRSAIDARIVETAAEETAAHIRAEDHVIVAGYGSIARFLVRVLQDSHIPLIILTLSPEGATEAEEAGLPVIRGDYSRQRLLELASIDRAKMLVIPDDDPVMIARVSSVTRALNPTLQIVVRTRFLSEVPALIAAGADQVLVEELEVAVELFSSVLTQYQIPESEIAEHAQKIRTGGHRTSKRITETPIVVCRALDKNCFSTRSITVRPGSRATDGSIGDISQGDLEVVAVERDGMRMETLSPGLKLREGDRIIARGTAEEFASAFPFFRTREGVVERETSAVPARLIRLSERQISSPKCGHTREVRKEVTSTAAGCRECIRTGDDWVHLRICMSCGNVACCDSSKNKHATKHFKSTAHPIMHSYQPGENWAWCYPDELTLE